MFHSVRQPRPNCLTRSVSVDATKLYSAIVPKAECPYPLYQRKNSAMRAIKTQSLTKPGHLYLQRLLTTLPTIKGLSSGLWLKSLFKSVASLSSNSSTSRENRCHCSLQPRLRVCVKTRATISSMCLHLSNLGIVLIKVVPHKTCLEASFTRESYMDSWLGRINRFAPSKKTSKSTH